jgi:hypothetical protein
MSDAEFPGPELFEGFLTAHDIKREAAGEALGVSRMTIWSWINRESVPSEQSRHDIGIWTNGAVPAESWPPSADRRKRVVEVAPFEPKPSDDDPPASESKPNGHEGAA